MGILDWLGPLSTARRAPFELGDVAPSDRKMQYYTGPSAALTVKTLVSGGGWSSADDALAQQNSAVYACLQTLATAFPEPPLRALRTRNGETVNDPASPLQRLLDTPNAHMTAEQVLAWTVQVLHVDGNAYWRKIRTTNNSVVELWPISPARIELRSDEPGVFISAYRYHYAPGRYLDLPPSDVVHFRLGIDDADHRRGLSPLKRLVRHVSSDEHATQFADALLQNFAVPGLIVQVPSGVTMRPEEAAELKATVSAAYGTSNRGNVGVLTGGATMQTLGFSPEQMDLKALHRIPEERIAAALGVPAIVAGLGAGLDRATYANMQEAREMFTESKLVPLWRSTAATLDLHLAPEFGTEQRVAFDLSNVRALADDVNAQYQRLTLAVSGGWLTPDEARAHLGLPPLDVVDVASVPEQRARARVVEQKAPDDLPEAFARLTAEEYPQWERRIRRYLRRQAQRIADDYRAAGGVFQWDNDAEVRLLTDETRQLRLDLFEAVRKLVSARLDVDIQLDDPLLRAYLQSSGALITNITDYTRSAVADAISESVRNFEGVPQTAQRLLGLGVFDPKRAVTIARTEVGRSANAAALANYRASGIVVGVTVYDGDYDAHCQSMNGRTFELGKEPDLLAHPRCRRAFAPIVKGDEDRIRG